MQGTTSPSPRNFFSATDSFRTDSSLQKVLKIFQRYIFLRKFPATRQITIPGWPSGVPLPTVESRSRCPTTIPAPFGHWLMPVNVFRSLWKQPGFPDYRLIMPFRNSVYERTPFLHEIDPGRLPDWQSGPVSGVDFLCRDTVRRIPQGVPPVPASRFPLPCPTTILALSGHWLMPVNVLRSLWKQPGFPDYRLIMPFRKRVYENASFLHEIDPGHMPDWQSGPVFGVDFVRRDTVRGISRKSPCTLPPLPLYDPGTVRPLVNTGYCFWISLEIALIRGLSHYHAFPENGV